VILFRSENFSLFLFSEGDPVSIVTVRLGSFHLCNNTGTSFNNGAGCLLTIGTEDTGHPNLFANNTFHRCTVCAAWLKRQSDDGIPIGLQSPFTYRPFPCCPSGLRSTGSKQTLNGLFICFSRCLAGCLIPRALFSLPPIYQGVYD